MMMMKIIIIIIIIIIRVSAYVVVNFLSQIIFVFLLYMCLGTAMYTNEVETKEK